MNRENSFNKNKKGLTQASLSNCQKFLPYRLEIIYLSIKMIFSLESAKNYNKTNKRKERKRNCKIYKDKKRKKKFLIKFSTG
jgi:hypothetical protein